MANSIKNDRSLKSIRDNSIALHGANAKLPSMQALFDLKIYQKWNRRNWLIAFFLLFVLFALEYQFYIVERAIGRYLAWNNLGREQLGPQWEKANNRLAAGSRLENIAFERRETERKLERIASFAQLLEFMANQNRLELSADHFDRIYNNLPFYLKPLILPPDSMLYFGANGLISNTLWLQNVTFLDIYFLNRDNQILTQATLDKEQIDMILKHGVADNMNIDSEARFSVVRTFTLMRFLNRLERLDYEVRQNFFKAMPAIFEHADPSTRIAISNKITNNLVEIAVSTEPLRAIRYYLPDDWINDLISVLDDEDFKRNEDENFL